MSAVVYARLPESLKQDLQALASERGLTVNRALVELLEQGLAREANAHSLAELEGTAARQSEELAQTRARLQEAELRLQAATGREQLRARIPRSDRARARRASPARACCLSALSRARARRRPARKRALPERNVPRPAHLTAHPDAKSRRARQR